jgi:hypothetical protein
MFNAPLTQTVSIFKLLNYFFFKNNFQRSVGRLVFVFKALMLNKYNYKRKNKGSLKRKIWRKLA